MIPDRKFDTLIFDFDGTIGDTLDIIIDIVNRHPKLLNADPVDHDEARKLRDLPMRDWFKVMQMPFWKIPFFVRFLQKELRQDIGNVQAFKGIPEVLRSLKSQGYMLGILTTDITVTIREFLKLNNLEIFDFVSSADFIAGKSFTLKRLSKKYNLEPSRTLYLGDTTRDIKDSKRAGMKVAGVTWGFNTGTLLAKYEPDYLLNDPKEILTIL